MAKTYMILTRRPNSVAPQLGEIMERGVKEDDLEARERYWYERHEPVETFYLPDGDDKTTIAEDNPPTGDY